MRRTYPYRDLDASDFDAIITMLSDGIATQRGRSGAFLHRDQVNGRVRGRRGARLAAITSGGAIPDTAQYAVVAEPDGKMVGTLDEDFAVESLAGDVFLLGTTFLAHQAHRTRPRARRGCAWSAAVGAVLAWRSARTHGRAVARGVATCGEEIAAIRIAAITFLHHGVRIG